MQFTPETGPASGVQPDELAQEVLQLSRDTLLVDLRFLDLALHRLDFAARPGKGISTDGRYIYYDAVRILRDYQQDERLCTRNYLHMLFHCVFRHNFISTLVDTDLWDLACDIAVESTITALHTPSVTAERESAQLEIIRELRMQLSSLTARHIYDYYADQQLPLEKIRELRQLFQADDHEDWYLPPVIQVTTEQQKRQSGRQDGDSDSPGAAGDDTDGDSQGGEEEISNEASQPRSDMDQISWDEADSIQFWTDTAQRMQTDLETFSREHGDTDTALFQNLRAVNRERYDYASFLRKFAVMGETMTLNPEEFDYIFYAYGMQLFGKMPLIEPLEYKENHRIREFVIAIDTSASTSGELVQAFVRKTYNLLMQEENFFHKINIHIIQCDEEIQEDVKITSPEEFREYLSTMTLRGFGNTDFRPVFSYVEQLRKTREFSNLKGLIYFTDGEGTFPEQKPDYNTAFVFVNDEDQLPEVPPWAIRLVLEPGEIENL